MMTELKARSAPQHMALRSSADILVYGGAAGGGKTSFLFLESTRHIDNPNFGFVIFRRTTPQITNEGGLWDSSFEFYKASRLNAKPREFDHSWTFKSGASGRFTHLEHDKTRFDWDGGQIPFIGFDQLEHFTKTQFFYLMTRNRSTCGVKPYIRATANPPAQRDHWLRSLVSWWIQDETGYPIPERAGVLRYFSFSRESGEIIWVEKDWKDEQGRGPKSFTFIPAKLSDNKILAKKSPDYGSSLAAQDRNTRNRLLEGNWNVTDEQVMFDRNWFEIIDKAPEGLNEARSWDRAATKPTSSNPDPDWTVGARGGKLDDILYITDIKRFRDNSVVNEKIITSTAQEDGESVTIIIEQEPGSSGVDSITHYKRDALPNFMVVADLPTGSKIIRAQPWCSKAEKGKVKIVKGSWNKALLDEIASFPNGKKDQIDAISALDKYLSRKTAGIF